MHGFECPHNQQVSDLLSILLLDTIQIVRLGSRQLFWHLILQSIFNPILPLSLSFTFYPCPIGLQNQQFQQHEV